MTTMRFLPQGKGDGPVLRPARRLMDRLSYPQKFLLIFLLFALPLGLTLYLLVGEIYASVRFARKEIAGTQYLRPLRTLQDEVARSRLVASAYARGLDTMRPDLVRAQAAIQGALEKVDAAEQRWGRELATASLHAVVRENARHLGTRLLAVPPPDTDVLHGKLQEDIQALTAHVGDTSNLILDPDLDSYYLMEAVLLKLPDAADLLLQARLATQSHTYKPESTSTDLIRLAGLLESNLARTRYGAETAFSKEASGQLKLRMAQDVQGYDNAMKDAIAALRTLSATPTGSALQVAQQALVRAQNANIAVSERESAELESLLRIRIEAFERRMYWVMAFVAAVLGVVLYLLMAFYAGVMRTVDRLHDASERMLGQHEGEAVTLETRDELGEVVLAFNRVADRLRAEKLQAETESQRARAAEEEVLARESDLVRAREAAEEAVKAKAAFLATMSHEIRTPLNGVVGMTALLAETSLDAEQRDFLQTIRVSSDQLLAVINDILDFSKIESGKFDLEHEPLSLRNVLEDACDIAAPRAREKGIELIVDMPEPTAGGPPAAILGDVTRLRQILINLVNNAVKFTDHGEVSVQVRLAQEADADGLALLEFSVQDTGIGIPPDRVSSLFQAFTQVDASTTRKYGGTGLGLAICKRLVELMGGDIRVRSEPGLGSTFTFTIRARVTQLPAAVEPLDAGALQGKRVLVVDDHPVNVRVLSRQLRQWGLLVASASSGAQAMDLLAHNDVPDLVITDMHMPGMDGVELARLIRAEPWGAKLPLVLLSSGFLPGGLSVGSQLFDVRLLKPARQNQLFDAVARCMAGAPAEKPAAERADVRNGIHVLVVDDNVVNIKVACAMLDRLGYDTTTAMDGREAVEATAATMAASQPFGAILMDLHMPNMDGLEATAIIQRQFGPQAPPIIALTADASIEDRDRCAAAGMQDYLTKPLQVAALTQALQRWTEGKARPGPAPAAAVPDLAPFATEPLVDAERLEEFREYDPEMSVVREALATMMADAPARLAAIALACAAGDAAALKREAHTLRGSAGNVGAPVLSQLCAAIEKAVAGGTIPPGTTEDVARLPACWEATREALQAWLDGPTSEAERRRAV